MNMTRREALMKMAVALGATVAGPRLLAAAFQPGLPAGFTPADLALLDEIGDTIIPPTHIPGAKAAGIGAFMAMMINDCYEAEDQAVFKAGLAKLPADYAAKYKEPFLTGQPANRTAFLNELDREQRTHEQHRPFAVRRGVAQFTLRLLDDRGIVAGQQPALLRSCWVRTGR